MTEGFVFEAFANKFNFQSQIDAEPVADCVLRQPDQVEVVAGGAAAHVDEKVSVYGRDHHAANLSPFQARRLDQAARIVAGRVLEHAAQAGPRWLRPLAIGYKLVSVSL